MSTFSLLAHGLTGLRNHRFLSSYSFRRGWAFYHDSTLFLPSGIPVAANGDLTAFRFFISFSHTGIGEAIIANRRIITKSDLDYLDFKLDCPDA